MNECVCDTYAEHGQHNVLSHWKREDIFFRPLSLSPPSEFIEEEEEKRAKNAKFFRFPADVFHMTLIRIIWLFFFGTFTVFENHRKSLIQHCERSELRLHFEWTKVN
mgnify:CR=1 FL=1